MSFLCMCVRATSFLYLLQFGAWIFTDRSWQVLSSVVGYGRLYYSSVVHLQELVWSPFELFRPGFVSVFLPTQGTRPRV